MTKAGWQLLGIFFISAAPGVQAAAPVPLDVGPHHVRWRETRRVDAPQGPVDRNFEYVQLESGLNRWDPAAAKWVPTDSTIELFRDGAIVRNLQYSVIFSPNLANPGAIDILLPDGQRLSGQIMGIAYSLGARSVLVAEVKDCVGEVHGNEVLFRSAFSDIDADVKFIVNRGSLSQHVILKDRLPHPSAFGLNEDAHVELMTEWIEVPVVSKVPRTLEPAARGQRALTHERVSFASMEFVGGHAFSVAGEPTISVASSLESIDNRTFLLEKIPWRKFAAENQKLPERQAAIRNPTPAQAAVRQAALSPKIQSSINPSIQARLAQTPRPLPAKRIVKRTIKPVQMAQAAFAHPAGLVWDWELVSTVDKQVWRPDSTYYVAGPVTIKTNEFWGGTVIKFAPTNSAKITITGPITSHAGMYQPITLTARDDHSIGDPVGANVLSGYYGDKYLTLDGFTYGDNYALEHVRARHANIALHVIYGGSNVLRHVQVVNSKVGLSLSTASLYVDNGLFYDCQTNIVGVASSSLRGYNCTFYTNLYFNHGMATTIYLTNCVLAEITGIGVFGAYYGAYNFTDASGSSVFNPALAGKAYLLTTSSARNAGTTDIPSTLLADLRQRTTAPPLIISNDVTLDTVWTRHAQRDTDLVDAGYHYDPIDYAVSAVAVSNATLVITGGVAVAMFSANGIYLHANSHLISAGTPHTLNRFCHHNAVQEQSDNYFNPASARTVFTFWEPSASPPSMNFRWTGFDVAGAAPYHLNADSTSSFTNVVVRDCQFRGGQIYLVEDNTGSCAFTNNLFEYNAWLGWENKHLRFHNNLFVSCSGFISQSAENQNWSFTDNLLDNSTLENWSPGMVHNYNAFYNSASFYATYDTNANEKILTSLSYDIGKLARYYLPTNSTLLNAGSTTNAALVGLYHFTTLTNNLKELTNHLDISWHLPALDSSGLLLDQDGDGIPDAFEDRNGNGVYDSTLGETDWSTYNSLFGIGPGPGLVVFTPLK
jgi:hypothetical protein